MTPVLGSTGYFSMKKKPKQKTEKLETLQCLGIVVEELETLQCLGGLLRHQVGRHLIRGNCHFFINVHVDELLHLAAMVTYMWMSYYSKCDVNSGFTKSAS